jgi:hypothetical protein
MCSEGIADLLEVDDQTTKTATKDARTLTNMGVMIS